MNQSEHNPPIIGYIKRNNGIRGPGFAEWDEAVYGQPSDELATLRSKLATVERERDEAKKAGDFWRMEWNRGSDQYDTLRGERDAALAEVEQQKKDHPRTP